MDALSRLLLALFMLQNPVAALRTWLHANVALVETKRGMLGALSIVMTDESKATYAKLAGRVTSAVDALLARAVAAGQLREGVSAEDLLQTMYALCYAREPGPGWREQVLKLLDIFVDGLRV